ncbi:MAG: hypothetical protein IPH07_23735 [Deltaproteobacteria bacterium]|nr:hypothetical protein [Deltaproteobacteria bacterium]
MFAKIVALLARLPSDRAAVDWVALALAVLGGGALLLGLVTPDQLPALSEALVGLLVAAGVRGASLAAKSSTQAGAQALADAVQSIRAGKPVPDELLALAAALVVTARRAPAPELVAGDEGGE